MISLVDQIVDVLPNHKSYMEQRGSCCEFFGRTKEARGSFEDFIDLRPGTGSGRASLTRLLFKQGENEPALKYWSDLIESEIVTDHLMEFRAAIHRAPGNTSAAEKDEAAHRAHAEREAARWGDPNHYYHYK